VSAPRRLDPEQVRKDFPITQRMSRGRPLAYLDNAASAQKPKPVIDAISHFYSVDYANIHRGVYELSERATAAFESGREKVQQLLRAAEAREIVFTRGTTEAINLVAQSFGRPRIGRGDEVLITAMEHHSNIVPWQILCQERGASLRVAPIDGRGELLLDQFEGMLTDRTRIAAVTHVSNAIGTVNPVRELVRAAHARGVPVLVDGAQAVPHLPVDVGELGCDFYAFSGHKLFGPSGIGALYGRAELLEEMSPWQAGGEMILSVTFDETIFKQIPHKFEAGTPDIAGAIGLGAAIDYLQATDLDAICAYEGDLLDHATEVLSHVPDLRLIGTAREKVPVLSFVLERVHAHDVGTILDEAGIAVRTGHHCAQPLMEFFGVPATVRASLAFYNTSEEVDALVEALHQVREIFP
jgi:cysteine desulfurase/selenocysteine lyase